MLTVDRSTARQTRRKAALRAIGCTCHGAHDVCVMADCYGIKIKVLHRCFSWGNCIDTPTVGMAVAMAEHARNMFIQLGVPIQPFRKCAAHMHIPTLGQRQQQAMYERVIAFLGYVLAMSHICVRGTTTTENAGNLLFVLRRPLSSNHGMVVGHQISTAGDAASVGESASDTAVAVGTHMSMCDTDGDSGCMQAALSPCTAPSAYCMTPKLYEQRVMVSSTEGASLATMIRLCAQHDNVPITTRVLAAFDSVVGEWTALGAVCMDDLKDLAEHGLHLLTPAARIWAKNVLEFADDCA